MGETEIRTADASGTVQNASQETEPTPKSKSKSAKRSGPTLNERGVPVTNWDNPDNDPNKRKHVGETGPTGKGNKLGKVPGDK